MTLPAWMEERNARFVRERDELYALVRAEGFRLLPWLGFFDPRTGESAITTSIGDTERIIVTRVPSANLRRVSGYILVGPDSEIITETRGYHDYQETIRDALRYDGVIVTIFAGARPT